MLQKLLLLLSLPSLVLFNSVAAQSRCESPPCPCDQEEFPFCLVGEAACCLDGGWSCPNDDTEEYFCLLPDEVAVVSTTLSNVAVSQTASYQCTFINRWSQSRQPIDYPAQSAHWSPMVVVAHNDGYEMWAPNTLASEGVESVAETGSTDAIQTEIQEAAAEDNVADFVTGSTIFNRDTQQLILPTFTMDADHPLLSTITMIAPSPDWFSGMYGFPMNNGVSWFANVVVDTYPWDAGTETGSRFSLNNPAQDPPENVQQLTVATQRESGIFLNPDNTTVLPVAQWDCTLQTTAAPTPAPTPAPTSTMPVDGPGGAGGQTGSATNPGGAGGRSGRLQPQALLCNKNGICEAANGETKTNCPDDCGECPGGAASCSGFDNRGLRGRLPSRIAIEPED